jgi:hypothetical protein
MLGLEQQPSLQHNAEGLAKSVVVGIGQQAKPIDMWESAAPALR